MPIVFGGGGILRLRLLRASGQASGSSIIIHFISAPSLHRAVFALNLHGFSILAALLPRRVALFSN
jgi:hypothetical protein